MAWRRSAAGVVNAWAIALLVALAALAAAPAAARQQVDSSPEAVKAAFLFNFAKFTNWPAFEPGAPLELCVVGDNRVATALADTVRGHQVGDRLVRVREMGSDGPLQSCHMLFVSKSETRSAQGVLDGLKTLPVLTVSDDRGFSRSAGIVELFIDSGRMRFAINIKAGTRSGLHLSSRLLGLARIEGDRP